MNSGLYGRPRGERRGALFAPLTYQPFVILSEAQDPGQGHDKLERPNTMTNNLALQKLIDDDAVGQLRRRDGLMATLGSEDGALNHSQPFFPARTTSSSLN